MAIITKIEAQNKNKDRVNIYVNETFFMAIFTELVYTFNLKKGMEIEEERLKEILENEMYLKCKNKAFSILSKCDQSEKRLKEKLSSEFEENTIHRVLDFLRENKLVDDITLAHKIVSTNSNLNKCGKNKIKQNLYNKGIDKSDINEALSSIDDDTQYENALYLGKKRYERVKKEDKRKIYQKISQHLAYKGFEYDIIKRVLNNILNVDEYDL